MAAKTSPKPKKHKPLRSTIAPELLSAVDAARFCGRSMTSWYRDLAIGRIPAPPVKYNGRPRWLMSELVAWIEAGCPDRKKWESLKQSRADR